MSTLDTAIKDYLERANKTSTKVYVVGEYDVEVKSPFHETPSEFIKMEETEPDFNGIEEDPDVRLVTEDCEKAHKLFQGKHSGFYVTPGYYGKSCIGAAGFSASTMCISPKMMTIVMPTQRATSFMTR